MQVMKCLFIDDGDVDQVTNKIGANLRKKGITLDISLLNPQNQSFKSNNGASQSYIDFDKIKSEMNSNFCNKRFDVVACDFNFANDDLNGYTLLQWLINESNSKKLKIRFAKFYCYSAEQDKFTEHLLTNEKIIRIIKLKLDGFYNRATLADELTSELLKIHRYFSLEKHILSLLQRNPDKVFNYIFPKYKGKSFSHIVNEIEKGTDTGYEFQQFFLDLTHAHIMNLNKD